MSRLFASVYGILEITQMFDLYDSFFISILVSKCI